MRDLFESLSMSYVFAHEDVFVLGVGALIVGLILFRFGPARRRADRTDRSS